MKGAIKTALGRAGIYYAKRQYMPCGIDWLWDIHRVAKGRPVRTVFDVGANVGQTTRSIKARFPAARVHAFEPVRVTCESLHRNVRGLDDVTVHELALSDRAGAAMMTAAPDSPLNHLVESSGTHESGRLERVECDTLDRFCAARQIDRIDLLKVDAEGADLKVLQGGERLFREQRVAFVFAEAGFDRADHGHVHVVPLIEHMSGAGLEPYAFYDYCRLLPPSYENEGLGLVFANVLFVSPAAIARLS